MDRVDHERAFVVLRSAQRALLRAEDEAGLLDSICRIAVDEAGYRFAWVGLAEDDVERSVRPVAEAGHEAGYLGSITVTWADSLLGRGPIGTAIRSGRPVVGRSFLTDPELAPWREQAIQRGFASALALPLRADDGTFGALTIYASEPDAFPAEDVELLSGLADDLAFGITTLRARTAAEADLRQSERSLAEAQRIAHIGSWERDVATGALRWSDESYRIFGLEPGAFAGTVGAFLTFVHPDDRSKAAPSLTELTLRDHVSTEYRIIRSDGVVRLLHEETEVIRDATGAAVRFVGSTQDITERTIAEAQRTRFARLLEELTSEIYVFDAETLHFTEANSGALRNLGYSLDELCELTPLDLKPELSAASFAERLAPLRTGARDQVTFETIHRRKGGSTYPVEVRVHLLTTETPPAFVAIVQDITERVAADAERTRLVAAIEQTADSIWMQDLDNIVTYVNRAFSRVYGYESDEIVGRHAGIVDSGRHGPMFFTELWASVASGQTWTGSIVNRRNDGTLFEVEAVISGIRDAAGRVVSYMQTDRDVTDERALEARAVRRSRERALIADAIEALRPRDTPEQTAEAICRRVVELPEIAMASLLLKEPDGAALPLAMTVDDGRSLERKNLGPDRSGQLWTRAAQGPWVEEWRARTGHRYLAEHLSIGLRGQAYAPVRSGATLIGLLTVGSREPDAVALLTERLPALLEFASLAGALLAPGAARTSATAATRASIQAILDAGAFTPFFQPIVELHTGVVVGYEALSRFADGTRPDIVFTSAARAGLGVELEIATFEAALGSAAVLPPTAYLSLNASPLLICSGRLGPLLAGLTRRIALEVTEHAVVEDYAALRRELATLGPSVRLAVDDAGAGYASLRHVLELAPDFVKLDIGLVRGIDSDPARQALIAGMGYFAAKRKVRLVAEGIETAAELETLRSLAIRYGQGYLLGRPQDGRGSGPWPTSVALPAS